LAIIIELLFYQLNWRLAVYGVALLFSYSGTGFIPLMIVVPAILVSRRSYSTIIWLALLAVLTVLVLTASGLWQADVFEARTAEFGDSQGSAYARFVAPADLIIRFQLGSTPDFLFGVGPGTILAYGLLMPYVTSDPPLAKVLFEYGLVGSLLFWPMWITSVFKNAPSVWISLTLLIGVLAFAGTFLDPRLQALLLAFCILPREVTAEATSARRSTRIGAQPPEKASGLQAHTSVVPTGWPK
jgi:hypothetical protein